VYTFGNNDECALGRVTVDDEACSIPGQVDLKQKVTQISAGDSHTAALTTEGRTYLWGSFRVSLQYGEYLL